MTTDRLERALTSLRVSVTDRCNFRCGYCMPREVYGEGFRFVGRDDLLRFEEIARVVRAATTVGVRDVRLTGGEPLLRRDLPELVAQLRAIPGVRDLSMTTNGVLLAAHAEALRRAGLDRVTVSLDALDPVTFATMSDTAIPVDRVLEGIAAAVDAGLAPVKVNAVVKRGVNESEILPLAEHGRENGLVVRFIEFMDVGTTNRWSLEDVVGADEIVGTISAVHPLEVLPDEDRSAPATRYRYVDGAGEIGVVASVTRPFCATCVRARLSPVGELFTCLFAGAGHDLRGLLRAGADEERLAAEITRIWTGRSDRYSELRAGGDRSSRRVEMHYIGG